ncbi:MAG TPA: flavin reductase family protein [Nordella sp.]|nr:flavin reductase family protein [Nordella sp.]
MSRTASGVYILTTDGEGGQYAATISAVASVSADPALLLACINRRNPLCAALAANRHFCVNALNAAQSPVSQSFAGRPQSGLAYDFGIAEWYQGTTSAKRLKGAVASFDCVLQDSLAFGTHTIFVGHVVAAAGAEGKPLLYAGRRYLTACALDLDEAVPPADARPVAIV